MKTEKIAMSRDGKQVAFSFWDEVTDPRAIVVIVHGMAEHISRYDDFAKFLNTRKYIVVGFDDRAHGNTDPDHLGLVNDSTDLFENTVDDIAEEIDIALSRYGKDLKVFVIGHSYGSFMTQRFMQKYLDKVCGVILSGSALQQGFIVNFGSMVASRRVKKGKRDEKGEFFANMTFVAYDKKIKDGRNGWLNRDREQVELYNNDPQCDFICSNGFYDSLFRGLKRIAANRKPMPSDFKLFIASGDDDGVGGYGKLVKKLYQTYVKLGISPKLKLYEGGRHEILNETNRQEVYADFADFIDEATAN